MKPSTKPHPPPIDTGGFIDETIDIIGEREDTGSRKGMLSGFGPLIKHEPVSCGATLLTIQPHNHTTTQPSHHNRAISPHRPTRPKRSLLTSSSRCIGRPNATRATHQARSFSRRLSCCGWFATLSLQPMMARCMPRARLTASWCSWRVTLKRAGQF